MKKYWMACLLWACGAWQTGGYAQGIENALLWEITGPKMSQPSYLFGTIHLLCQEDLHMSDSFKALVGQTKQLALEYDMDEAGSMAAVQAAAVMKGKTLKNLLPAPDYLLVRAYFQDSLRMPLEPFIGMKPMLLSTYLTVQMLGCQTASWEISLMDVARKHKLDIVGVESLGDQLAIFERIPLEKQAEMLVEGIKKSDEWRQSFREMVARYKEQDVESLYRMVTSYSESVEEFESVMLTERNTKWIPVMQAKMEDMPTFFAVGAGHLGGPEGVVALLRKAGYQLKPVVLGNE